MFWRLITHTLIFNLISWFNINQMPANATTIIYGIRQYINKSDFILSHLINNILPLSLFCTPYLLILFWFIAILQMWRLGLLIVSGELECSNIFRIDAPFVSVFINWLLPSTNYRSTSCICPSSRPYSVVVIRCSYQLLVIIQSWHCRKVRADIFSCDQAALWMIQSVRRSARISFTPFSLCSQHRIIMQFSGIITIDRSDDHTKGQGQRLKSQRSNVLTQFGRLWTVTRVWMHRWLWNDA